MRAWLVRVNIPAYLGMGGLGIGEGWLATGIRLLPVVGQTWALWPNCRALSGAVDVASIIVQWTRFRAKSVFLGFI